MDKKTKLLDKIDKYSSRAKKDIRMADSISLEENEPYKNLIKNMFVLLFYSHIEGIIKNIAQCYINFIKNEEHSKLTCHFYFLLHSNKNNALNLFKKITGRQYKDIIDTEGNLSYDVLLKILFIININPHKYTNFEESLNDLLEKRNDFAHGDVKIYENTIHISDNYIKKLKNTAINLIDIFCNDIKDCIENDVHLLK